MLPFGNNINISSATEEKDKTLSNHNGKTVSTNEQCGRVHLENIPNRNSLQYSEIIHKFKIKLTLIHEFVLMNLTLNLYLKKIANILVCAHINLIQAITQNLSTSRFCLTVNEPKS